VRAAGFKRHTGEIYGLAASGDVVLTSGGDGYIKAWRQSRCFASFASGALGRGGPVPTSRGFLAACTLGDRSGVAEFEFDSSDCALVLARPAHFPGETCVAAFGEGPEVVAAGNLTSGVTIWR
jgi:hypothetical protein